MTSRMKRRFLVAAVSVFASVSLASAQDLGGAASEKGASAGQEGGGMSQSATGASHGEGMRQGDKAEPRETGGAERPARESESGRAQRDEPGMRNRERAEGRRDGPVPAGSRTRFSGGGIAAADLSPDDIRVVQRVLIERGLLHGEADGVLGPETREAISAFQRQQGIQVTGSIDARTVSSLGVSGRLSQQANQSIGQPQSSPAGAQTSTMGQGQAGTGQARTGQPQPSQQNATGQAPSRTTGQATSPTAQQNQPSSSSTGQSMAPNQSNTTRQAAPRTQSENKPAASEYAPSDTISLTFTDAAIAVILLLALGALIIVPAV